jgi:hypothetical protein
MTLVELIDDLRGLPSVRLIGLHPHPQAKGSFVADVEVHAPGAHVELHGVAEEVYRHTGALVVFHERQAVA